MKTLLIAVAFCLCLHQTLSAPHASDAEEGHCNSLDTGPMKRGEHKSIGEDHCAGALCTNEGKLRLVGCAWVDDKPGCTRLEDKSLPHPQCCPKLECN